MLKMGPKCNATPAFQYTPPDFFWLSPCCCSSSPTLTQREPTALATIRTGNYNRPDISGMLLTSKCFMPLISSKIHSLVDCTSASSSFRLLLLFILGLVRIVLVLIVLVLLILVLVLLFSSYFFLFP